MKRRILLLVTSVLLSSACISAAEQQDTTVYLLTCAPGTATYSIYGHSALRVVINSAGTDMVYNWGVFDFSTPNFAWKFAKGRLDYMLAETTFNRFLMEYMYENRSVWSQKINLDKKAAKELLNLISENLREENRYYRYDFFYDNCSTRIRDLLEKVNTGIMIYPPEDIKANPTFNARLNEYLAPFQWLRLGVSLLMGRGGSEKAGFRDRMFLPMELMKNLSAAVLNHERKMEPLLMSAENVLEFDPPVLTTPFWKSPLFVFSLLFILVVLFSARFMSSPVSWYFDVFIFLAFSVLALLMTFFSFFTDHLQMKMNANILWFNPVIIFALAALLLRKPAELIFRIVFLLSLLFVPWLLFGSDVNTALLPLVLILSLRASARSGFQWNPFNITD